MEWRNMVLEGLSKEERMEQGVGNAKEVQRKGKG
jgi:hypothetical protein